MKILNKIVLCLFGTIIFVGCQPKEMMNFGETDLLEHINAVRFPGVFTESQTMPGYGEDAIFYRDYSFANDPELTSKIYDMPLVLTGSVVDYDRKVGVKIVSNTAQDGFELIEALIPANETYGRIRIKVDLKDRHSDDRDTVNFMIATSPDLQQGSQEFLRGRFTWSRMLPGIPGKSFYPGLYNLLINNPLSATNAKLDAYSSNAHLAILTALGWQIGFWGAWNSGYDPYNFMTIANGAYNTEYYQQRIKNYLDDYKSTHGDYLRHNAGSEKGIAIQARVWKTPTSKRDWVVYDPTL